MSHWKNEKCTFTELTCCSGEGSGDTTAGMLIYRLFVLFLKHVGFNVILRHAIQGSKEQKNEEMLMKIPVHRVALV